MKRVTILCLLVQVAGSFAYSRFFERGLCLQPKNGFWTSTQRFEKDDILDLGDFQFRTYTDHSQCLADILPKENDKRTAWNNANQLKNAPASSPATAVEMQPLDPDTPQFLHVLLFPLRFNGQVEFTESLIGREDAICCSGDAFQKGYCRWDDLGTLILNQELVDGTERLIRLPSLTTGEDETFQLDDKIVIDETNEYTLLIANCNYGGANVQLLPAPRRMKYLGLVLYYSFLAVYTASLCAIYGRKLFQKEDTEFQHPLQKYLFVTMILVFYDFVFKACAFSALDVDEPNHWVWSKPFIYTAVAFPVLKRGLSVCLGLLVAKGWGILEEQNTTRTLAQIINLGVIYTGLVAFRDYLSVQSFGLMVPLDGDHDFSFSNIAFIIAIIVHAMDILIALWMIYSLCETIFWLREEQDEVQVKNYVRLRWWILVSMLIAAPFWIFRHLGRMKGTRVSDVGTFVWAAIIQLVYVVVLTNVSMLMWGPPSGEEEEEPDVEKPRRQRRSDDDSTQQDTSTIHSSRGFSFRR